MAATYDPETRRRLEDRKRKIEQRRAEQIKRRNNYLLAACGIIVVLIFVIGIVNSCSSKEKTTNVDNPTTKDVTTVEMTTAVEETTVAKVYKKTTDSVNFRKKKKIADKYIIETLPKNTKVEVVDESDDEWCQIIYDGKTGYVSKEYLK